MATDAPPTMTDRVLGIPRRFTRPDVHPYDEIAWGVRDTSIVEPARDGRPERVVFDQRDCEFPVEWSDTAVRIVASKYFRYGQDDPRREGSLRQVIDRVVDTIHHHGVAGGYFADAAQADDLRPGAAPHPGDPAGGLQLARVVQLRRRRRGARARRRPHPRR